MTQCYNLPQFLNYCTTNKITFLTIFLFLFAQASFGQTPSDTCDLANAGAEIPVNVSCPGTPLVWDSVGAGNYWTAAAGCGAGNNQDVWGWFEAVSTPTTIAYTPASNRNAILHVFSVACSPAMVTPNCSNVGGNGVTETVTIATTPGNFYSVRIQRLGSNNDITGTICITSPAPAGPANDDCAGAITLTVNNTATGCSFTTGTNVAATASAGAPVPICASYAGGDVWYTITVPPSGSVIVDTQTGGIADSGMAIYSGTCGALTEIECDDDDSNNGLMSYISLDATNGITPGQTLYIRVWEFLNDDTGSFGICAYEPPNPCGAVTNIPNCGVAVAGTIAAGTGAYNSNPCFIGTPGNELIYTYTPTSTGNYSITQNTTYEHINYMFRPVGASCDGSGYTCIGDLIGNGSVSASFTMMAGTTYYIMLDSEVTTGGNVNFTIDCPPPTPPNDLCANATNLFCLTIDAPGTTVASTDVPDGFTCLGGLSNYGVWYTFVGDGDQTTISTKASAGFDHQMVIASGASCGALTEVGCDDGNGAGGVEDFTWITTNGLRYYVYVAHWSNFGGSSDTGDFTITRICTPVVPPTNDDPCGAENLNVNGQCIPLNTSNEFATATSGVAAPTCGNYAGGDVWFTATVPPNAEITFETSTGQITDGGLAVYSASPDCNGTLTQIACDDDGGTGLMSMIALTAADGIVPGDVLYIRFWEDGNNNNGTFGICAYSTIPAGTNGATICQGDPGQLMSSDLACSGTTNLGNSISGNLDPADPVTNQPQIFITSSDICGFDPTDTSNYDVIPFNVNQNGTYVFTMQPNVDLMGYIVVAGSFTYGSCSTGTWIAGDDDSGVGLNPVITANLQAGVPYELVTAAYCGCNIVRDVSYTWDITTQGTEAEWYTTPTGGSAIATGATFNPVGAAGSGLPDTNTPGTYSYYVACPGVDTSVTARIQADFVINATPSATISGMATGGACSSTEITITITDPTAGASQWFVSVSIDGGAAIDVGSPVTSPFTFTATAPAGSVYTLDTVFNFVNFCPAQATDLTGDATVISGGKTWNGSTNTDWNVGTNWTPNGVPTSADCVVIPNVANDPIMSGTTDGDAASLTVLNGGYLYAQAGATLTVVDEVVVVAGGTFELEGVQQDSAQLIQVNDVANSGNITLIRETNVRNQDYVYWSSPVENFSLSSISNYNLRFQWIPTVLTNVGFHGEWDAYAGIMTEGKGYIVRGPNGNGNTNNTPQWNPITFTGVPHNGDVSIAISRGAFVGPTIPNGPGPDDDISAEEDNWNLVGNPYPSALDADLFIGANGDLDGTIYLWNHGTKIQNGSGSPFYGNYSYNYNQADYTEYNLSGSTPNGWLGVVGSGQGFFVQMLGTASTPGTVTFNNGMRDRLLSAQFFKNGSKSNKTQELERHRIWLDLVTPNGDTNTALIAYAEGATNERDRRYDAPIIGGYGKNLYSLIGEDSYIIQGRSIPLDVNDTVSLGMFIDEIGVHAIAINEIDGLFKTTDQGVFIEDLELGTIHNLKLEPYFFTASETGIVEDRFVIRYTDNALSTEEFNLNSGLTIMAPNSDYIKVISSTNTIDNIIVYDMLGRVLIDIKDVNANEFNIENTNLSDGALIVKATLVDGRQKIQKVVLKK